MPHDLLQGGKRPGYFKQQLKSSELIKEITETQAKLSTTIKTFSATVYDYEKMERMLLKYKKVLNRLPETHQQTMSGIRQKVNTISNLQFRSEYLNTHFSSTSSV